MRTYQSSWSEALNHIDCLRPGVESNLTYVAQLEVWQVCGYDVYEVQEGRLRPKRPYMEWIDSTVNRQAATDLNRYCVQS